MKIPNMGIAGSGKINLMNDAGAVLDGLRATLKAMRESAPHGRDFHNQQEFHEARQIWLVHYESVETVLNAYEAYLLELSKLPR